MRSPAIRRRLLRLCTAAVLLASSTAAAGPLSQQAERGERRLKLMETHRQRLEHQLSEQGKRIARLKRQPKGVRVDFQLEQALRQSQTLAGKLTELRSAIRAKRKQLLALYDKAIAGAGDAAQKRRWQAKRRELVRRGREAKRSGRLVVSTEIDPLASADDLEEKADLLDDSGEKLRRQLRRLKRKMASLRTRAQLRRHKRAARAGPFIEDTPRRIGRTRVSRADRSGGAAEASSDSAAPKAGAARSGGAGAAAPTTGVQGSGGTKTAPPASPSDNSSSATNGFANGGGASSGATAPRISSRLRQVLDPRTFRALRRAGGGGSTRKNLSALDAAAKRLDKLAASLSSRAKALRSQAKAMRKQRRHKKKRSK